MAENDQFTADTERRDDPPAPIQPGDGTLSPNPHNQTPTNPVPTPVPPQVPGNNPYAIAAMTPETAPTTMDGQPVTNEMVLPEDHEEPLYDLQTFRTYLRAAALQAEKEVTGNSAALLGRMCRDLDKLDAKEVHALYLRWLDDLKAKEDKAAEQEGDDSVKSVDETAQFEMNKAR